LKLAQDLKSRHRRASTGRKLERDERDPTKRNIGSAECSCLNTSAGISRASSKKVGAGLLENREPFETVIGPPRGRREEEKLGF